MGLTKNNAGEGVYLNISDGKIVRIHKTAITDVTETRITKTGKTVHEEKFSTLTGFLRSMKTEENEWGIQWRIVMEDEDGKYWLSVGDNSRYATSLLKALPNINLDKKVRIMPWSMIDKKDATKKITGITCYQGDDVDCTVKVEKILPYYTKETPNGLPEMKQIKINGKMAWDSTDMNDFLKKQVELKFMDCPI